MNYNFLRFDIFYKIIIVFIIILLLEGIFHHYYWIISQKINFLNYKNQIGYNNLIWQENGLVEILQVIFLLISIIFIISYLKKIFYGSTIIFKILIFLYLFGILYYFFEEISWGQHIFGWETPEFFLKINKQGETNIHNAYSVFNELPRNLLLFWCSLSFIIIKIKIFKNIHLNNFIFPSYKLKFISFLIIFFFISDFVVDKLDLGPSDPHASKKELMIYIFFEIISFNFIRLSELQEFLFNTYIMCHAYFLLKANYINKLSMLDDRFKTD